MKDIGDMFNDSIVSSIANELGYNELFDYCENNLECNTFEQKMSIPVGHERITPRFQGTIILEPKVDDYINSVVKPYTDKGLEVPYFLIGNCKVINDSKVVSVNEVIDLSNNGKLNSSESLFMPEDMEKAKSKIANGEYDFIAFGHSHPQVTNEMTDDRKINELYHYLRMVKSDLDLRGNNLDMTMMDVYAFIIAAGSIRVTNPNAIVMGCTYHHDGELNFLCDDENYNLSLATNIYRRLANGELEPIDNYDSNKSDKKVR